jgi:hypothetical protein
MVIIVVLQYNAIYDFTSINLNEQKMASEMMRAHSDTM